MMMKALELGVDEPVDFKKASLKKGRIEIWVEDHESIDFLRNAIPLIPNAENNRTHKYIFLGPGEHVSRFFHAWVPCQFAKPARINKIGAIIQMMNSSMKNVIDRISYIRVAKTVDSTRINQPGGHVLLVLELEDDLFKPLVKLRGKVLFGIDSITLTDKSLTEAIGVAEAAATAAAAAAAEASAATIAADAVQAEIIIKLLFW